MSRIYRQIEKSENDGANKREEFEVTPQFIEPSYFRKISTILNKISFMTYSIIIGTFTLISLLLSQSNSNQIETLVSSRIPVSEIAPPERSSTIDSIQQQSTSSTLNTNNPGNQFDTHTQVHTLHPHDNLSTQLDTHTEQSVYTPRPHSSFINKNSPPNKTSSDNEQKRIGNKMTYVQKPVFVSKNNR